MIMAIIPQVLVSGLLIGGVYALLAVGLTLIFGVLRVVNFAQGEFIMLAMFASFWLFTLFGIDPYLSIFIIAPMIFLLGLVAERIVINPILNAPHAMQIFATFALSLILQNIALVLWGPDFRSVNTSYSTQSLTFGILSLPITSLMAFVSAAVMGSLLIAFLNLTRDGRALRALVQNRYAASLMGINVVRLNRIAFGVGVACAAIAGCVLTPIYYTFPTAGVDLIIIGFVVVVLGGMGNIAGAMIGGLIIGIVQTFTGFFISVEMKDVVALIIFILILLIRPHGLLGTKGAEELGTK
jgi:branched-chain amino acid transport system permease protein